MPYYFYKCIDFILLSSQMNVVLIGRYSIMAYNVDNIFNLYKYNCGDRKSKIANNIFESLDGAVT